jgi:2-phospho-L-lactate/phosphoenolpyruvate guanylyltransferase
VKTLRGAKSRLRDALGEEAREALVLAMLEDVLTAVRGAHDGPLAIVSRDPALDPVAARYGAVRLAEAVEGYNEAVRWAYTVPPARDCDAALVLPADLPQLTAVEVRALLEAFDAASVVLSPSGDGGTSALGMCPPGVITTAFGLASGEAHRRLTREAGLVLAEVALPGLTVDVDTIEDLRAVDGHVGPATRTALEALPALDGVGGGG